MELCVLYCVYLRTWHEVYEDEVCVVGEPAHREQDHHDQRHLHHRPLLVHGAGHGAARLPRDRLRDGQGSDQSEVRIVVTCSTDQSRLTCLRRPTTPSRWSSSSDLEQEEVLKYCWTLKSFYNGTEEGSSPRLPSANFYCWGMWLSHYINTC